MEIVQPNVSPAFVDKKSLLHLPTMILFENVLDASDAVLQKSCLYLWTARVFANIIIIGIVHVEFMENFTCSTCCLLK